jgi:hypothetical protein
MRALLSVVMILGLAAGLAACGERDQEPVTGQSGEKRYQGKRDTKPWDNDPLALSAQSTAGGGKWAKGDRASWETQIKARQLGQHEDKRIYQ